MATGSGTKTATAFQQWEYATLNQIGAPINQTNLATLQKWAAKESGASPMRWNNPLNSTQPDTGSSSAGATQASVQRYPTPAIGADATAITLTNGRYPGILAALRQSVPTQDWLSFDPKIAQQLGTWGSGTNWLGGTTQPSNFLAGASSSASDPCAGLTGFAAAACQVQQFWLHPNPSNPLDVGTAITAIAGKAFYYVGGGVLMLAGAGLLVLILLKGSGAVGAIGGIAGAVTPQGRAVKAVGAVAKPAAPAKPAVNPEASTRVPGAPPRTGAEIAAARAKQRAGR